MRLGCLPKEASRWAVQKVRAAGRWLPGDSPARKLMHPRFMRKRSLNGTILPRLPLYKTLDELRKEAQACKACDLWRNARQTVFGEGGESKTKIMFVGEQPGDREDLAGKPFVGPAGQLLDRALAEAGVGRELVYVTNAVKHFKFEERGKRRIHAKPRAAEIAACRPWLEAEVAVIQPRLIVALGATAAQALLGSAFRL